MSSERSEIAKGKIKVVAILPDGRQRVFGDNSSWLSNPYTQVDETPSGQYHCYIGRADNHLAHRDLNRNLLRHSLVEHKSDH